MCGICGVIGVDSKEAGETIVRQMMAAIVHRGPDEEGILLAPPVAAGVRRLNIIDLPGGSQPIWNETGTTAVVFNGEIYNFRELRAELEACGHTFRTRSDTEVIVHSFETWGESCVEHLRGMFAFAVVEVNQSQGGKAARVFMARDRLGIKPLYYAFADGALLFASEVRALLASGSVSSCLSREALPSYLLFGSVSEPLTLVEGVLSLPPGHFMEVSTGAPIREPRPKRYWRVMRGSRRGLDARGTTQDHGGSPSQQVRSLLEAAVKSHLVADVPVGVFLSSGLDSTTIAALATRAQGGIHTFTVAFPDVAFSEAEKARRTAARLGTDHRELTLTDLEMLSRLDEAITAFDQPSMDGINTYFVSWAARQAGLKVALSGLGSDELFGGYTSFHAAPEIDQLVKLARFFPRRLRAFVAALMEHLKFRGATPDTFRKGLAAWVDPHSLPHPYFFARALFTPQTVSRGTNEPCTNWRSTPWWGWLSEVTREAHTMDGFTAVSWLELRSYLTSTLLRDTDAMSMWHSLEVRVPFLDSPLVEYILSVPEPQKRRSLRPKALLIEAVRDLLPDQIITQPKRTFTFPWENWLRGALGKRVEAGLSEWSPALDAHLSRSFALGIWRDFQEGRTTWSRPWSLYVLNEWAKRSLRVPGTGGGECRIAAVTSAR
jgi:asparagine synthase (glutamine-hydrolysing)